MNIANLFYVVTTSDDTKHGTITNPTSSDVRNLVFFQNGHASDTAGKVEW